MSSSNFSGKDNRRPRMYTRVPPPPVASTPTIPLRSIRRTIVAQPPSRAASFRETPPSPRPLVIRKRLPLEAMGSSPVKSAPSASGALPIIGPVSAGIQALIGDIDRFAKEWTEMFDGLSSGVEDPEDRLSKLDASIHIRPTGQPEDTGPLQADHPAAATGKGTPRQLQPVHFDVTPASLTRWQHRDKSLVNDTPEDGPVRDHNLLSKRLLTFNHYVRKVIHQWLRKQIRRQKKCITYRKQPFETRLFKQLLRHRDIFRLSLR